MPVIRATGLVKRYGRRVGIDGVDLEVEAGSIFGFLGPNGAGKTTAIRVLLGFLRADAGNATMFGRDCWTDSAAIKRDIGYVPGDLRLYSWMTGHSGLDLVASIRDDGGSNASKPVDVRRNGRALCTRLRLDPEVPVRKMSRGMRQKLGLILALAHEPRLIILDEPTSGLDPLMQDELMSILRERAAAGATVFFSSHTLAEVEKLCDRIAIVRDGRIVADESLESLRKRAKRSVTILFRDAASAGTTKPPPALSALDRAGTLWRAELSGETPPFVAWLQDQPIADVTIGPPDLESLFRAHYRREDERKGEVDG